MLYPDVTSYIRKNINPYSLTLRETETEPEGYGRFLKITTLSARLTICSYGLPSVPLVGLEHF